MAALSAYSRKKVLDHALGTASWTMPTQLYVALYTVAPGASDAGTEVTGGSYARQSADFTAVATNGVYTANTATVTFPAPTANWGQVVGVGLRDASSGGNLIFQGAPQAIRNVVNGGQPYTIPAGQLVVVCS